MNPQAGHNILHLIMMTSAAQSKQFIITFEKGRKPREKGSLPLGLGVNRGLVSQPPAEEEWCVSTRGCPVRTHIYYTMILDPLSMVWYNVCMENTHGGARPGAGRPKKAQSVAIANKKLQNAFTEGLSSVADNFVALLDKCAANAVSESKDAGADRRFLIKLLTDTVKIPEDEKTPYYKMMQQWAQVNINVDGESRGHIESVEARTIPRAE